MDAIRVGFLGLGGRGANARHEKNLGLIGKTLAMRKDYNITVTAVCDEYQDRVELVQKKFAMRELEIPFGTTNPEELFARDDVDVVVISAAWEAHVPLAIAAMKAGKGVGMEVGGAYSVQDCFDLVRVQEQTKVPFMFLENCCYGRTELMVTKMVREGLFGEISYCHGAYSHDLREEISGGVKNRHYRLRNYITRNCDNYPTHQLGPIAKLLNINRGNRMLSLTAVASKARGLNEYAKNHQEFADLKDVKFAQGDVVHSLIKCADGTVISLKLNTTLPGSYSREFTVNGTKGMYTELGNSLYLDGAEYDVNFCYKNMNNAVQYEEKYDSKIWKGISKEAMEMGHGGIDYLVLHAFYRALKNDEEMPIDVYDAASWMAITALSEQSVAMGGTPVAIPDFTGGKWVMREPKDVCEL